MEDASTAGYHARQASRNEEITRLRKSEREVSYERGRNNPALGVDLHAQAHARQAYEKSQKETSGKPTEDERAVLRSMGIKS